MEFISVEWTEGKVKYYLAVKTVYFGSSLGKWSYFVADFIFFFSVFSKAFQNLIFLGFVVMSFKYLP